MSELNYCVPPHSDLDYLEPRNEDSYPQIKIFLKKEYQKRNIDLNLDHSLNDAEISNYLTILQKLPKLNVFQRISRLAKNR